MCCVCFQRWHGPSGRRLFHVWHAPRAHVAPDLPVLSCHQAKEPQNVGDLGSSVGHIHAAAHSAATEAFPLNRAELAPVLHPQRDGRSAAALPKPPHSGLGRGWNASRQA